MDTVSAFIWAALIGFLGMLALTAIRMILHRHDGKSILVIDKNDEPPAITITGYSAREMPQVYASVEEIVRGSSNQ